MYGSARTITNLEGSPSRSPRLPRSPRLGHRRTSSGGGGGTGKTLSMENIQSLNAAYATSGPMYLSDHEGVASTTYPKGTMTLGRATNRAVYGGRVTAMGSSPNIASAGLSHTDVLSYTDQHGGLTGSSHHHHHQVPSMLRQVRDSTMLDLQAQLKELQRENDLLRKELDIKDSKLGSSMNSIKTFWSPELKKERVLRKEEAARMSVLKEQMRVSHEENQLLDARRTKHLQLTIQALQDELRTQRDLNHLLQQESGNRGAEHFTIELTEENFRRLQAEHDRQAKELFLLRKTLEEMELRIETQKQTLNARDESIKKLLEMLQSKGLPSKSLEDDNERTRRMAEAESQVSHLEVILDQKEKENIHLREELHRRSQLQPEPAKTKALQTVIEMKDTKIASLERNIRDLEDEIQMLKANGVLNTEDREEEIKQIEVYKSHSKFMKTKIDQLKQELSKKESELLALQTKLETLSNQNSDCKQHIEVLKESLTAKEQRAAILQTEVDALRLRLEEKESFLNKKTKQLQDLTEEKGTLAGEIRDMKDMLEVKERKINVLQKKIENLQEQLRDKDKQLTNLKDRVKSLQTDSSNTDTALATLEEALSEKERIIERLKEQRERDDRERLEEIESFRKENKDLKEKVNALQAELTEKESSLIDLKEHASSLASAGLKRDSKLKSLEIAIEQKKEECSKLEAQLKKQAEQLFNQMYNPKSIRNNGKQGAHNIEDDSRMNPEFADRIKQLDKEASYYRDECGKAQAEVDRLLEILKEVENEKNDKDKKIAELERHMKDQNKKVANLKHNQQLEKKKNAQLLEEVRRREDSMADNSQHLQAHNIEDDSRMNPEFADRIKQLDKEASYYRDECGKAQAEVDRLLEILKEVENEKNDKDKKIAELESLTLRHMKDQNKKVANLKHNQQLEKKKNAQLLEEVRRREDSMADNSQHLQIEELMNALEKTRQELDATKARLASTQQSLAEKEAHLANLRIERRKQLEEILEMKQEALLAAISEKDANIALLELSASKKKKTQEEVMALKREKDRLVHQLKQQVGPPARQTQNRMKLMADNYDEDHHHYHHHHHHHHHRSPGRSQHSNHRPSPDQLSEGLNKGNMQLCSNILIIYCSEAHITVHHHLERLIRTEGEFSLTLLSVILFYLIFPSSPHVISHGFGYDGKEECRGGEK
ncbi:ERC protein 2 isoform X2 [Papio anubis]|uniref:ERC protein 2 isoform X2 n=1 Tax=Papio anubis TaxID=9555 RepID=UPI0012AE5183|nr:ERC protein 2 isoform X2 [Papio anubis]